MDDIIEREVDSEETSLARCRELLGGQAAESNCSSPEILKAEPMFDLPLQNDGARLRSMVGAVIYIRVSTKEQTENLSLPTIPRLRRVLRPRRFRDFT